MSEKGFSIWAIIILLGAAQGIFLFIYLLLKKENRNVNKWLAFLLAVVSVHLAEYAADISGLYTEYPFILACTYPFLFLMGPFFYIYCRKLVSVNDAYRISFKTILHFLPAMIVLLLMMPFYLMPGAEKISMMTGIENGAGEIPAGQLIFMGAHAVQTALYVFAAYKFLNRKNAELKDLISEVIILKKLEWLNRFCLYFLVYTILYLLLVTALALTGPYLPELDYAMLIITAASFYLIAYSVINNPEVLKSISGLDLRSLQVNTENLSQREKTDNLPELKEKLLGFMESGKPYLKSDIKLSELADSLSIPAYRLSQVINDSFSENFYDFINKYRVEEAKTLLRRNDKNYKILAIAFDAGFNSKATFNRVFKNYTGFTPTDFRQKFIHCS